MPYKKSGLSALPSGMGVKALSPAGNDSWYTGSERHDGGAAAA
jgi:hypothetical protein